MKKMASLITVALIFGFSASCGTNPDTGASPSPKATASPTIKPSPSPTPVPTATPSPVPTATPTPIPTATPNPLPLEQQTFNVEINLENASNPYVQIDGGGSESLPLTVTLSGGRHEFFVFDISSSCKIGQAVTVDKDHTKFVYKSGVDCNLGR